MTVTNWLLRYSKRRSRRHLYEWLEAALQRHGVAQGTLVLNIGAGGEIAAVVAAAGVSARSLDIDPTRAPDIVASAEQLDMFGDASVDAIIVAEVLEHLREPERAVAEFARVLRAGGVVIGSSPFLLGIHDQPHDYYRYTLHGLNWLFRAFEPCTLRERNGYFGAVEVLVLRRFAVGGARQRALAVLLAPLLLALALVLRGLDRVLPSLDGTSGYFFVYRKPAGGGHDDGTTQR